MTVTGLDDPMLSTEPGASQEEHELLEWNRPMSGPVFVHLRSSTLTVY